MLLSMARRLLDLCLIRNFLTPSALSNVYPFVVWNSIQRKKAVPVEALLNPPTGFLDSDARPWSRMLARMRIYPSDDQGLSHGPSPSMWIFVGLFAISVVSLFAHTAADFFLDFVTVGVESENTYFLSSSPGGLPSMALLGDTSTNVFTFPSTTGNQMLQAADDIAQGVSRFSFFPPGLIDPPAEESILLNGVVKFQDSKFALFEDPNRTFPSISEELLVQCQSAEETAMSTEMMEALAREMKEEAINSSEVPPGTNVFEHVNVGYVGPNDSTYIEDSNEFHYIPVCNYDKAIHPKTMIEQGPDDDNHLPWKVEDWAGFSLGPDSGKGDYVAFGVRVQRTESFRRFFYLSPDETLLTLNRDSWQQGRSLEDGLTIMIGLMDNDSDGLAHPQGATIQMEFSVLSGPHEEIHADFALYVISSWSHKCPTKDYGTVTGQASGAILVQSFPNSGDSNVSGCLVDAKLLCTKALPQDRGQMGSFAMPGCLIGSLQVMHLSHLQVDRSMLAAYAGIATRNGAMNGLGENLIHHTTAVNSVAAAYILTRQVVPGTVKVEGVRAAIGPFFVLFLFLPLICLVPLLCFITLDESARKNMPRSAWDVLVLGARDAYMEENNSPEERPSNVCFGWTPNDDIGLFRQE
mmetsp:Transcript_7854/g.21879  ORF Transcript_7854/g.21879 Transcript_7854/m.21879 type:complete len:636 (+) Transcript_7854:2682-4589(+)